MRSGKYRWLTAAIILATGLPAAGQGPVMEELPQGSNVTVITSRRLDFDYKRSIAVFEEDVLAVDAQITIRSDQLTVIFDKNHDVKSVTALGNVRLRSGDKTGVCERAVYITRTGEIVLTGDVELSRGRESVMGERITFWIDQDRMTCEPGRVVIMPGSGKLALPSLGKRDGAAPAGRKEKQSGSRWPEDDAAPDDGGGGAGAPEADEPLKPVR